MLTGLSRGARGTDVRRLQERLAAAGLAPGAIDGVFGPSTDTALRGFQRLVGLAVTGRVDDATAASLEPRGPGAAPAVLYANPLNPHQRRLVSDYRPALRAEGSLR